MSVKKMKIKELPIMVSDGNYSAKYPKSSEFVESGIPFIRANNIKDNKVIWNDIIYISKEKHSTLLKGHLKKNDVLFTVRGILGHVGIVGEDFENANINAQIALLRADDKYINPKYLMYSLNTNDVKSQIERNQTGTTLKQLPISRLKELVIVMREKSKQDKIVKCLDKSYELIINRKEQIKELDLLVKSKFIEMFGDPINNPMKWEVKKMKDISVNIMSGNTPKGGEQVYVESGIMFLRSQNVWKNKLLLDDVAYIDQATHNKMKKSSLKNKDILMTKTGRINTENSSLGRAAMFLGEDDSANINGHVYLIRLQEQIINEFVLYILTSKEYRGYIRSVCVGGIDKRQLNKEHIEDFPIIFPPIEKQKKFVSYVKQVDKLKFEMENSLKKLEDNFNSLMQKSFNGELV
ncbi:restriction endonuclease subunit S [Clostridium perfringens]|uniref:restriction endonuclease subunit S n=1 Tax=Clostridium perfringens TaxID=1502 RepID=UPI001ABAE6EB|nr:restriction endonuclease subunit S [Clostridium perfringens]MBO3376880.1 restriction endonuclease subunit S [Clostridium perfringens]